ncbi:MAG: Stealth CR1 domain-containing protein [Christensenellales bacterium]|nr:Stealth CR1 domain-containing protein [Christensenellales bacterium]
MEQYKVDFVLPWVDGNDLQWQKDKANYAGTIFSDGSVARYRDWENLQYVFRGIETFTPWYNKIHLITYGHLPKWLNTENPRLNIVNHKDFIPNEYLPVFSCNPFEVNLHKIPGLSEHFVYLNDDIFFLKPLKEEYFFKNGLPCDMAALSVIEPAEDTINIPVWNAVSIVNKHFSKRDVIYGNFSKWFRLSYRKHLIRTLCLLPWGFMPGFYRAHGPASYVKKTWETLWAKEPEILKRTSGHRFRESSDVAQFLFKMWQLCEGNFYPRYDRCMSVNLELPMEDIRALILGGRYPIVCLNDRNEIRDFEGMKNTILEALDKVLPEKSTFEK